MIRFSIKANQKLSRAQIIKKYASARDRTTDLKIFSLTLSQLSYKGNQLILLIVVLMIIPGFIENHTSAFICL